VDYSVTNFRQQMGTSSSCTDRSRKNGTKLIFLFSPAGGKVTVELAMNRAFTSYSYNGTKATAWPDGKDHPDDYRLGDDILSLKHGIQVESRCSITNLGGFPLSGSGCLSTPNRMYFDVH
jgi:hypothetical protein